MDFENWVFWSPPFKKKTNRISLEKKTFLEIWTNDKGDLMIFVVTIILESEHYFSYSLREVTFLWLFLQENSNFVKSLRSENNQKKMLELQNREMKSREIAFFISLIILISKTAS